MKDVRVPENLQRAMAAEAEAAREARAKVIAAEGEHKASKALRQAAEVIVDSPAALQVQYISFKFNFQSEYSAIIRISLQHNKLDFKSITELSNNFKSSFYPKFQ